MGFTFAWLALHDRIALGGALLSALAWATPGATLTALILLLSPRLDTAGRLGAAWIVSSLAWWGTLSGINVALFGRRAPAPDVFALAYMAFVVAAFVPLLAAVRHQTEAERGRLTLAETLASLRETQLHALRWQLNPHFLFNALNTISTRIDEDPRAAQSMIADLAALLRDSLDSPDVGTVDDEARRIELYFRLQRARFEDGLRCELSVDPAARAEALPPLLLQPLVENAVLHGMRHACPASVTVNVRRDGERLSICVSNTGSLADATSAGVGVANVRRRLELFAPGRHTFELREADGIVRATITIEPR
ncbi:MAG: histidine kinase [Myxococcales bacterium]|nr:histidine kinase [Myxococcales bacterium]